MEAGWPKNPTVITRLAGDFQAIVKYALVFSINCFDCFLSYKLYRVLRRLHRIRMAAV